MAKRIALLFLGVSLSVFLSGCDPISGKINELYVGFMKGLIRAGVYIAAAGIVMAMISLLINTILERNDDNFGRAMYIVAGICLAVLVITQSGEIASFIGSIFNGDSLRVISAP